MNPYTDAQNAHFRHAELLREAARERQIRDLQRANGRGLAGFLKAVGAAILAVFEPFSAPTGRSPRRPA